MGRVAQSLIIISCLLLFLVVAGVIGMWPRSDDPISVDSAGMDFGEVWVQEDFRTTLHVRNSSAYRVDVRKFAGSCNCVSFTPSSLSLAPNEEKSVELVLDLMSDATRHNSGQSKPFSVDIVALASTPSNSNSMSRWTVHGQVKSPFKELPKKIDFGEIAGLSEKGKTVEVRLLGNRAFDSIDAYCVDDCVQVDVQLLSPMTYLLTTTVSPADSLTNEERSLRTKVYLKPRLKSTGEYTAPVPIPVVGRFTHGLSVEPSVLYVGPGSGSPIASLRLLSASPISHFEVQVTVKKAHPDLDLIIESSPPDGNVLAGFQVGSRTSSMEILRGVLTVTVELDAWSETIRFDIPVVYLA